MIKFQMEISDPNLKVIGALMRLLGISTKKELFNLALSVLRWTVLETKAGNIIVSEDEKTGKSKELVIPYLNTLRVPKEDSDNYVNLHILADGAATIENPAAVEDLIAADIQLKKSEEETSAINKKNGKGRTGGRSPEEEADSLVRTRKG